LCGLWIDDAGKAHTCYSTPEGSRREQVEEFRPFAWLGTEANQEGVQVERLKGEGTFNWLAHAESLEAFELFFKAVRDGAPVDVLRPYESQWLLQRRARLFAELLSTNCGAASSILRRARRNRGHLAMLETRRSRACGGIAVWCAARTSDAG